MSDRDIIDKMLTRAIQNGWKPTPLSLTEVIFDLDFAKAFFGEEPVEIDTVHTEMGNVYPVKQSAMDYHLQRLAIIPQHKRLEYIGNYLSSTEV